MASATNGIGAESAYNGQVATLINQGLSSVPRVEVSYTSESEGTGGTIVTTKTTISGSQTPNLVISSDRVGIQTVRALVNHPDKCFDLNQVEGTDTRGISAGKITRSGREWLASNTATFETISSVNLSRSFINHELVTEEDDDFNFVNQNLFLGSLPLQSALSEQEFAADVVYAPEEDLTVVITMAGSAGQNFNGNRGGQGGTCKFEYTLKRNTEYVFKLGATIEPTSSLGRGGAAAYFYEKGRLLVVCGGGGGAGWRSGRGGAGGGPSIAGQDGSGGNGGAGGRNVPDGQLPSEGRLPRGILGGKIESCTTGYFYAINGYSPCEDVEDIPTKNSITKWYDYAGNENEQSAEITRGYKASDRTTYGFRHNGGDSLTNVNGTFFGGGGAGAYGGNATSGFFGGGGGGSGYTSGDVQILESNQGGNGTNRAWATIALKGV